MNRKVFVLALSLILIPFTVRAGENYNSLIESSREFQALRNGKNALACGSFQAIGQKKRISHLGARSQDLIVLTASCSLKPNDGLDAYDVYVLAALSRMSEGNESRLVVESVQSINVLQAE